VFSVQTIEERRFINFMEHLARCDNMRLYVWDMVSGLKWVNNDWDTKDIDNEYTRNCKNEHERILAYIKHEHENMQNFGLESYKKLGYRADVYILLDFQHMLKEPGIIRRLKQVANINSVMSSIIVGNNIDPFDSEMTRLIPNLSAPFAEEGEYEMIIDDMVRGVKKQIPNIEDQIKENRKALLKSLEGKTLIEAQRWLCKNLVSHKKIMGE
jgi:hypothetical protein